MTFSKIFMLAFASSLILATGCNDCPDTGLIGPGFLQSTIHHYNIFSSKDTIRFENFDGEVKEFIRLFPETKRMVIREGYLTVGCVEDDEHEVLLSSELERIDNVFATIQGDTISIGLKISNTRLFDPFIITETDLTSFPIYLDIDIDLNQENRKLRQGYIAYGDNREGEQPDDWEFLQQVDLDMTDGSLLASTFRYRSGAGFVYYRKDQGLVGFTLFNHSRWRVVN